LRALAILRRELVQSFVSPLGWVVLGLFLLVQGYSFYLLVEMLAQPVAPHGPVLQYFFGGTFLYWLFVILIVSVLTMRLCAEERRSGTLETLLTAPVTETEVVLGKYVAAVLYYAFLWTPTVVYVALAARLAPSFSFGPVLSGSLGPLLIGASAIAIGLLASALTRSQVIAAVLTFTVLSLLLLLGPLELFVADPWLRAVIAHMNLFEQMDELGRGIVDSRRLVLHLSLIVFCLVAAVKTLELRRWR
jgi:ABC-type transport system involved in multi-copper enzyme maturation permease subunit